MFGQFQYQVFDFAANSRGLMIMQNYWVKKCKIAFKKKKKKKKKNDNQ